MPGFYLEDPERRITASQTNGSFGALVEVVWGACPAQIELPPTPSASIDAMLCVIGADFATKGVAYIKFEDIRRVCPLLPAWRGGEIGQGSLKLAVDWLTAAQSGGTGRHPLVFWRQKAALLTSTHLLSLAYSQLMW